MYCDDASYYNHIRCNQIRHCYKDLRIDKLAPIFISHYTTHERIQRTIF